MQEPLEIDYNEQGYLLLTASVAQQFFPSDTLLVLLRGDELWLMPTRGAVSGGLMLKQRNLQGDRSVLIAPYLPPETTAGRWLAFWDEREGALRAAFRMPSISTEYEPAIAAKAVVVNERGRWVVYLDLGFSQPESGEIRTERKRIADYATEQSAAVAAKWIERTADRNLKNQNTAHRYGF